MIDMEMISVQVCYASLFHQELITLYLPANCTVEQAIQKSGILQKFNEIDLSKNAIGVYGKIVQNSYALHDQDRIEIYRPLKINPMQARRKRAELQR